MNELSHRYTGAFAVLFTVLLSAVAALPCGAQKRYDVVAVRTNLLMPLLNAGVEVPIGNRWSVGADFYYPWVFRPWMDAVTSGEHTACVQAMGGYLDGRIWLGDRHSKGLLNVERRLLGHSVGIFGTGGYFDWEMNSTGRQGEWYGGGVSYLYAVPLGRKSSLHLEFEFGVGVYYVEYRPYNVYSTGPDLIAWGTSVTKMGLLPLKAGVNLTVPLQNKSRKRIMFGEGL